MDPETKNKMDALERGLAELDLSIKQLAAELGGKIVGLDGRVSGVEHRIDAANKHVQYSLWGVGAVLAVILWMLTVVHGVQSAQNDTTLRLNELAAVQRQTSERLDVLAAAQRQTTEQLQKTTEQLQNVSEIQADAVERLEELGDINARLTSIEDSLEAALRDSSVQPQQTAPGILPQENSPEEQHNENRMYNPDTNQGISPQEKIRSDLLVSGVKVTPARAGTTVDGIRGSGAELYKSHTDNKALRTVQGNELKGAEVIGFAENRAVIVHEGNRYWVKRYRIRLKNDLDVPRPCDPSGSGFAGSSAARGGVRGCN